jgi:hypothetical protein
MKHIQLLIIVWLTSTLTACAGVYLRVEDSTILAETNAIKFSDADQKLWIGLNRGSERSLNVFDSAKALTVNGYRIIFHPGSDEIYIIKNKQVLLGIHNDWKYIYDGDKDSPGIGSERVAITDNYLKYRNSNFSFEDYGLDGVDVKYQTTDSANAESYLHGKKCEKTLVANAACCRDAENQLRAYMFSFEKGWTFSKNEKLLAFCSKVP